MIVPQNFWLFFSASRLVVEVIIRIIGIANGSYGGPVENLDRSILPPLTGVVLNQEDKHA